VAKGGKCVFIYFSKMERQTVSTSEKSLTRQT
jgi:hypothetical protein